jgi:hypothetical protein
MSIAADRAHHRAARGADSTDVKLYHNNFQDSEKFCKRVVGAVAAADAGGGTYLHKPAVRQIEMIPKTDG